MKKLCQAGRSKLVFRYDGKVFPCEAFKEAPDNEKFIVGDISVNTMEEIWFFADNNAFLNELKEMAKISNQPCPAQLYYDIHDPDKIVVIPKDCINLNVETAIKQEIKNCNSDCRAIAVFSVMRKKNIYYQKAIEEIKNILSEEIEYNKNDIYMPSSSMRFEGLEKYKDDKIEKINHKLNQLKDIISLVNVEDCLR